MMNNRNEMTARTGIVLQDDWEQQIVDTFEERARLMKINRLEDYHSYRSEIFLDKIWEMSLHAARSASGCRWK